MIGLREHAEHISGRLCIGGDLNDDLVPWTRSAFSWWMSPARPDRVFPEREFERWKGP